jgi:hypothetical protein
MSPNGTRYPRTPTNETTLKTMHALDALLSNKKPMPMSPNKIPDAQDSKIPDAKISDAKIHDTQSSEEQRAALDWYHKRQLEMDDQLLILERLIEEKDAKHSSEIQREHELRRKLQQDGSKEEVQKLRAQLNEARNDLDILERERLQSAREQAELKYKKDPEGIPCRKLLVGFSSGVISSPDADVVLDLAEALGLEAALHNDRYQTATLMCLFETSLTRFPSLKDSLAAVLNGQSVEWALNRFSRLFTSFVNIKRMPTLDVIRIIALSRINNSLRVKVDSAVKVAASVHYDKLQEMSSAAEVDGVIPVLGAEHKLKTLYELPGLKQILSYDTNDDSRDVHWSAFSKFVCAIGCFVGDRKGKLEEARNKLNGFRGAEYTDHDLFISEFEKLFDVCTSWFRKPIENDFDKLQRVLRECPEAVKAQYIAYVTDPVRKVDELSTSWNEFCAIFQIVWKSAFDKLLLQRSMGIQMNTQYAAKAVVHQMPQPRKSNDTQVTFPVSDTEPDVSFQDKTIKCIVCPENFLFSVKQQISYKEKGFEHDPRRCPKCRGQICDIFKSTGSCPYGDDCKFLHSLEGAQGEQLTSTKKLKFPCKFFEAGRCERGDSCGFEHVAGVKKEETVHAVRFGMPADDDFAVYPM